MQENTQNNDSNSITPVNTVIQAKQQLKQNNFLPILLSVLLMISVIVSGFFVLQTQKLAKELALLKSEQKAVNTSEPTTEPLATTSSEFGSTTDWKIYTSKYKYSLKYPAVLGVKTGNWTESGMQYGLQPDDEAILRFVEPNQPLHGGFPYGTTITLKNPSANVESLSAVEWANRQLKGTDNLDSVSVTPVTIAGIQSSRVNYVFGNNTTIFYIPYNKKMYEILITDFLPTQSPNLDNNFKLTFDYNDLYDRILSTLKFLN